MPTKIHNGFAAIFIVILMVFLTVLVLGGIYYYAEIYQPTQYTKEITQFYSNFYSDFQTHEQAINKSEVKSGNDYKDIALALNTIKEYVSSQHEKLNNIKPPVFGLGKQVHLDFQVLMKTYREAVDDASERAEFMAKAVELEQAIHPKTSPLNPSNAKAKDLQDFYENFISKIKQTGSDLFKKEPPPLHEVSFTELKTSWEQAQPGINVLLEFVRAQDPNAPLDPSLMTQFQTDQAKDALNRVDSFDKLLKAMIDNNTVSDIMSFRFFTGKSQEELRTQTESLALKIQQLQKRYLKDN